MNLISHKNADEKVKSVSLINYNPVKLVKHESINDNIESMTSLSI